MGILKKKKKEEGEVEIAPPKLVRRKENKNSTWKSGRTIGERREKMETASERAAAHKKNEKRRKNRIIFTILGFAAASIVVVWAVRFFATNQELEGYSPVVEVPVAPTIQVVDEGASSNGITSRMKEYIAEVESDLREYGYTPAKAVIPKSGVREVDFYLDEHPGFIKFIIDRPAGVSAEDADRMIRYLTEQGISEYSYIDVRIDGKAYWK